MVLLKEKDVSLIDSKNRKVQNIKTNFRTYESYLEDSTDIEYDKENWYRRSHRLGGPEDEVRRFLSQVHESEENNQKVRKTVSTIVRTVGIDWYDAKHKKKEYLYYIANFYGKDLTGVDIPPATGVPYGIWWETVRRPERDEEGKVQNRIVEMRESYDIPFSKKAVDEVIEYSDDSNIKYCVKFQNLDIGEGPSARCYVTYDMFANWTLEDLVKWFNRPKEMIGDYTRNAIKSAKSTMTNSVQ